MKMEHEITNGLFPQSSLRPALMYYDDQNFTVKVVCAFGAVVEKHIQCVR